MVHFFAHDGGSFKFSFIWKIFLLKTIINYNQTKFKNLESNQNL